MSLSIVRYFSSSRSLADKHHPLGYQKPTPDRRSAFTNKWGPRNKFQEVTTKDNVTPGYRLRTNFRSDATRFRLIPEMQVELVVPDLTGFQLKPYVSYETPDVSEDAITPKELFDNFYADKVVDKFYDTEGEGGNK